MNDIELSISIDISLVFQALLSFEGLSIWKLSPYVFNKYRIDEIGRIKVNTPNEIIDRWWGKNRKEHLTMIFLLISFFVYIFIYLRSFSNKLANILKYSPYFTVVIFSLCILVQSVYHPMLLCYIISGDGCLVFIFYFIIIKFSILVISFLCNFAYYHLESFKLPKIKDIEEIENV